MLAASCRALLRPLPPACRLSISHLRFSSSTAHVQARLTAHSGIFPARTHDCGALRASDADSAVVLAGWLLPQRKISNSLSFFTIKDSTGTSQIVVNRDTPQSSRVLDALADVPVESIVLIQGSVRLRPQKAQRKSDPTGEVEVLIHEFMLLNPAEHQSMPFLPSETQNVPNDELRARCRHLDLRRQPLAENLRKRSVVAHTMRGFLHNHGFIEVETPVLLKSTPEGAREFLVPTRLSEQGRGRGRKEPLFYSLAQSPQQPKQLLICSGAVDKYYQFARCFRDEDGRKDRQPEFTQVDLEMAFVSWGNQPPSEDTTKCHKDDWRIGGREVRLIVEGMIQKIWGTVEHVDLPTQFPVMSYSEAMSRYGSDKPDTRFGLEILNVTNLLPKEIRDGFFRVDHILECIVVHAGDALFADASNICERSDNDDVEVIKLTKESVSTCLGASKLLRFHSGNSSSIAAFDWSQISERLCLGSGDLVWLSCRKARAEGGSTVLGRMRLRIAEAAQALGHYKPTEKPHFLWVTEFPLFTRADDDKAFLAKGRWISSHHPFTAPVWQDVSKLLNGDIESVRGQHYDLVLNGVEIGGGSVRVHDAAMQEHIFTNVLQLSDTEKTSFDHLLHALRCGAPPHGGIALGFDRLMTILCGTQTIRDVIAFPKTGAGTDVFFKSPSPVPDDILTQYGIQRSDVTTK